MRKEIPVNAKHLVILGVAALFTVGCGYGIKTSTDYDRHATFSSYRTFYLLNGNSSGSPGTDQLVSVDVASALTSRGWREVPDSEAQAAVVINAATKDKRSFEALYQGRGEWHWHWSGFNDATRFAEDYKTGTLVVDIFDARTKEGIWHGVAVDALSNDPTAIADATERAVDEMFINFPPASQGIAAQ
jgi:hypothetical protein